MGRIDWLLQDSPPSLFFIAAAQSAQLTEQEIIDIDRMNQTWDDISDKEKDTIEKHDLPFPGRPTSPTISTTTIYTPGNGKMEQAMGVKMVADEFLKAAGTVAGAAVGMNIFLRGGKPVAVYSGAKRGHQAGEFIGETMWDLIN